MLFSSLFTTALLATGALATDYGYGSGSGYGSGGSMSSAMSVTATAAAAIASGTASAGPAPSGMVSVQVVKVSDMNGDLRYYPDNIQAAPGTMVQFQFYPKNHTVTQSPFANPCTPINQVMSNVTGFKSGFQPVTAGQSMPIFTLMVNDTAPIWFFCGQTGHCQKGMVGVINAPGGAKTIDTFRAMAMASGNSTSAPPPASPPPSGNGGSSAPPPPGTSTTSSSVVQQTGAAARIAGSASLAGVALAAYLFVL